MIPQFPEFKKIELSDKDDVEKFTDKFSPSSDFNFAGTYSWDVRDQMKISQLNNNYVIRFIDYLTGEPFYTFIGINKINETIQQLLDLSLRENLKQEIKLIPEYSIKGININLFKIEEERDNFDYIYSLEELKNYSGSKFARKRNSVSSFLKKCPNVDVKIIDLNDPKTQENIIKLFNKWIDIKNKKDDKFEQQEELVVLKKIFSALNIFNFVTVGIFCNNDLIGFCINELTNTNYVMAHIAKTDTTIIGSNSFLMQKNAEILISFKKEFLNYEQDLGLLNLRDAKLRFRPAFFLKKYLIKYNRS